MHKYVLTIDWIRASWNITVETFPGTDPFNILELINHARRSALVWFANAETCGVRAVGLAPGGRVELRIIGPKTQVYIGNLVRPENKGIGPTTIPPG